MAYVKHTDNPKMGRPKKELDKSQFESLCSMMCTAEEIADFFHVDEDTVNAWCKRTYNGETFSVVRKRHAVKGKISIRRAQLKMAEHNPTMAIWLGKQYLGQTDKIEETVEERVQIVADLQND